MSANPTIALLPLDNRPVSYLLPKQIADFSDINLFLPDRGILGGRNNPANLNLIEEWIKRLSEINSFIASLDSWTYGGLVSSRRHNSQIEDLTKRVILFTEIIKCPVYAFSSILRIPNYNSNEEEKDYWLEYGEKIFLWSQLMYRIGRQKLIDTETKEELIEKWHKAKNDIPSHVIDDYKSLRLKNYKVNLLWLELLHREFFKYLIFSCDDSGEYGINVYEAECLNEEIKSHNFNKKAKVISGTDEIPLILMTKSVLERTNLYPTISLYFNNEKGKDQIPKYESMTIYDSVMNQLNVLGLKISDNSDVLICCHTTSNKQGDHIFKSEIEDTEGNCKKLILFLENINKPFILLDLAYANGADPKLIELLLKSNVNMKNCYGYSGWNTCSNTIGSGLSIGINRWISEKNNVFNKEEFKKCILTRFLDDYAYQAVIRHKDITEDEVNAKMKTYIEEFSDFLTIENLNIKFKLPWERSFEIEIII